MKKRIIWITPKNDLEAKAIGDLLKRNNQEYLVTKQGWGASWEMIETNIIRGLKEKGLQIELSDLMLLEEIDEKICNAKNDEERNELMFSRKNKVNKILLDMDLEESEVEVVGIELQGNPNGFINIDHHCYGNDDRSNEESSIEQVAKKIGVELNLKEKFIAANDKGFIPAMQELGEKEGFNETDTRKIINFIRRQDRAMQNITLEQEEMAENAIKELGEIKEKQKIIIMNLPHSKASTVTDRLFGNYDNLLILSGDGETNFFGETEIINKLDEQFKVIDENGYSNCWKGGSLDEGYGYWGGYANQKDIKESVQKMFSKQNDKNKDIR